MLTDAGYDVLGVDYSEDMLRIARRHAPKATFERAALLDVDLPSCVGVTAVGEVFNYAFDPRTGASQLPLLFRGIARALQPGGVLIFDVTGPGRLGRRDRVAVRGGEGCTVIRSAHEDADEATLTRDITVFRKVGGLYRRSDERHVLRLYRRDEVMAHLDAAGFWVRRLSGYGSVRFERGWAGFRAVK